MSERDEPADPRPDESIEGETVATEEPAPVRASELEERVRSLQDRLLRLQAEFDNFRKREARERAAAWARAKADLIGKLLGPLDDLDRVAHLDPSGTATAAVVEGVSLVERKVLDVLEREGLAAVGEPGEPFDPQIHEAIGVWPADSPEMDGTVAAIVSRGYRFGDQLLRPAQVQVYEHRSD
jgi:molecular chaperone GrpE